MSLKKIIDVASVNNLLKKGIINKEGVRLLDCSCSISSFPDWKKYEKECYGKFEMLINRPSPSRDLYLSGHIPEAAHIDLNIAMYPSKFQKLTQYSPEVFEKYAQLIGLNSGEHFIFYSRGAQGGMMFGAKLAWLFKSYGHEKISLIDGGFDAWNQAKYDISTDDVRLPKGNWKASDAIKEHVVTFEELEDKNGCEKQLIEKTDEINFLDARIRGQFNGTEDTGLDPHRVNGTRIKGFKNCPSAELVDSNGLLKKEKEIEAWLNENGYTQNQKVITHCNTGVQASFLAYTLDALKPDLKPRVYNGSLKEMELRDPKKISEGPQHLPY
ncbi:unnamed protein product [Caenorhabditis bovis]|uniref:Rhodanese domain-containing protein n=1 Tax=Caenorhabditis bovis TaxID=2654633 RepID=A0A8S1E7H3_9PELO|nr:unnamed protein product [Caenorhabditis bovis]